MDDVLGVLDGAGDILVTPLCLHDYTRFAVSRLIWLGPLVNSSRATEPNGTNFPSGVSTGRPACLRHVRAAAGGRPKRLDMTKLAVGLKLLRERNRGLFLGRYKLASRGISFL